MAQAMPFDPQRALSEHVRVPLWRSCYAPGTQAGTPFLVPLHRGGTAGGLPCKGAAAGPADALDETTPPVTRK